jgi:hypothetical protein
MDSRKQLAALLADEYGLAIEKSTTGPREWVGRTYVATERGGRRVFVKTYASDVLPGTVLPALPALRELRRLGVYGLTNPVPSVTGRLHERTGDEVVVVFEYIDAALRAYHDAGLTVPLIFPEAFDLSLAIETGAAYAAGS